MKRGAYRMKTPDPIIQHVFNSKPVEKILRSALRQKRRFSYDREKFVLRAYAMARPVHEEISHFVYDSIFEAAATGIITSEERKFISCDNTSVLLVQSGFNNQNTKKLGGLDQVSGCCYSF